MTWPDAQPIDTALSTIKEGEEILSWDGCSFHVVSSHGFTRDDGSHAWFNGDCYVDPTHWWPLPPEPDQTS